MPGRTPNLYCDRASRLPTDSLAMLIFHKYDGFEVLGLRLADGNYLVLPDCPLYEAKLRDLLCSYE